ncbi:hypothetical protein [Mesorhizobium sp. L103C131B0]|uniref:hypothetical protein n=1 Tax=Mesorhizobium sp. L103C131B0 TaxID=1287089 RepID=UPI0003D04ADA|nr:hypothetical protein [Mesorhizobium sp. L103C131B0]ESZ58825.1 hypothetical protein X729_18505 [Mesorhizobium sp. L103C131B0]
MAVARKDQERATYAWMYAQASKDGKETCGASLLGEHTDAWLQGFDGEPVAAFGKTKTVNDEMEAEVDEAAVERPAGT